MIAKQRAATNIIIHLLDEESGQRKYAEEEMEKVAVSYFSKLFTSEMAVDMNSSSPYFFKEAPVKVSDHQNRDLLSQVSAQEVKEAIFDIGAEKTPGPVGLTGAGR